MDLDHHKFSLALGEFATRDFSTWDSGNGDFSTRDFDLEPYKCMLCLYGPPSQFYLLRICVATYKAIWAVGKRSINKANTKRSDVAPKPL